LGGGSGETKIGTLARYAEVSGLAKAGSVMYADFQMAGQWFAAMDSGVEHAFTFNEAVSLSVACKDQAEIDHFWAEFSSGYLSGRDPPPPPKK